MKCFNFDSHLSSCVQMVYHMYLGALQINYFDIISRILYSYADLKNSCCILKSLSMTNILFDIHFYWNNNQVEFCVCLNEYLFAQLRFSFTWNYRHCHKL